MTNALIKSFLEKKSARRLYEVAEKNPTPENIRALEEAFKQYALRVKQISYIKRLIKGYSIDFDKRIRSKVVRQSIDDEEVNYHNLLPSRVEVETEVEPNELFTDERIHRTFQSLKDIQKQLLIYKFVKNLKNKEIARLLGYSEQRVSYNIKSAIEKLKKGA
ncbi:MULTISPECIES: sigma-70 family RNA polymerase sigma factor [Bacillaceae]|uniref:RNA polymerase sigma factor 70 region 4 type 2 domain-containing protein n=1 Tax=Alkalicoccobacillus plakortidis TaxID=444060 RepID=A0A9D5I118_9BACI|nr:MULTISPECIES: sigma-70 family RNA polymerase sigma factor [Bacillaceae]KQL55949.1 hypothetical protein AN965_16910 [Alkalicoccobacillus plakortidis]